MSEEKEEQLEKLILKYKKALQKIEMKQGLELKNFKLKIVEEGCFHPAKHIVTETYQNDNGYGRWWTVQVQTCGICKKQLKVEYLK